jgi:hypothetical protein
MHCHEHIVTARNDSAIEGHSGWQESADERDFCTWEAKLPADTKSEGAPEKEESERRPEILETDHLVVVSPKVFADETDFMVGVRVGSRFLDWCFDGSC